MFCIFYVPLDSQTNWKICPWKELNFQKLYLCFSFFPQLPLSGTEAHSSEIFWVGLYKKGGHRGTLILGSNVVIHFDIEGRLGHLL